MTKISWEQRALDAAKSSAQNSYEIVRLRSILKSIKAEIECGFMANREYIDRLLEEALND